MLIQNYLNQSEGQTLEFSKDLPSKEELAKIICAFSNISGGNLILGVEPETKELVGVDKEKIFSLRASLNKLLRDIIEPIPSLNFKVLSSEGLKFIAIEVSSGNLKPYFLKGFDKYSGTYIRNASECVLATKEIVDELDRQAEGLSYDSVPYSSAAVEDLNTKLIDSYNEKKSQLTSSSKPLVNFAFMERNGFIIRKRGKLVPTVASLLCFSDKVNTFFPKAKVKCKIYDYEDTTKLVDLKTFSGPLMTMVDDLITFLADSDVPKSVVQELVINALIHRDYTQELDSIVISLFSNRVEIFSPGYIPCGLTFNDICSGVSVVRNQLLYKIFSDLGYCCTSDSGISYANKVLKENNLNQIQITGDFNGIVATVHSELADAFYSKEEIRILEFLETAEYINNTQCQKLLKVKGKQAQYILTKLVKKGRLESIGEKKGRRYLIKN